LLIHPYELQSRMYGMQRIWVLCKHCGSNDPNAFFGVRSMGIDRECPTCGSNWRQSQIIASTVGERSSEILGDLRTVGSKLPVKVIWLDN